MRRSTVRSSYGAMTQRDPGGGPVGVAYTVFPAACRRLPRSRDRGAGRHGLVYSLPLSSDLVCVCVCVCMHVRVRVCV